MIEDPHIHTFRCRDSQRINQLLLRDYYDSPVCFFPKRLLKAASRWLARSSDVYFVVAESNDESAGYVFGHTFGPNLWRIFALQHLYLFPHIGYALLKQRMPEQKGSDFGRFDHARPQASADLVSQLDLPRDNAPFRWSSPDSRVAYVDMLYIGQGFRGRGLASQLLRAAGDEMEFAGAIRAEAHIDPSNYASLRAFLKAGWNVVQTSTDDFKATCDLDTAT